ncbi:MAG: phosphoribosylglycinamide formyltransferase [Clostridia bacterium]|nr:phosphoribosylglycinamide formyltransferase [Clostridia bacterium]
MLKTNIAVFVSGGGTNLQALIDAQKAGIIKSGEIKLVISSSPAAYALERAAMAGIDTAVVSRKEAASQADFEKGITDALEKYDIDLIVLAGFMSILSADFTRRYENRIINVHPSLIPSFCGKGFYGLKVHEEALKYGVKVSGATVHFVNEIPDGGKIILQKAVEIEDGDTPETLQKRIMEKAEWIILPEATEKISKEIMEEKNAAI